MSDGTRPGTTDGFRDGIGVRGAVTRRIASVDGWRCRGSRQRVRPLMVSQYTTAGADFVVLGLYLGRMGWTKSTAWRDFLKNLPCPVECE